MNNSQKVENIIEQTNEVTLEDIQKIEQEKFKNLDSNTFMMSLIVVVIISMIFEAVMKFLKSRIDEGKQEEKDNEKERKALGIVVIVYFIFLIIFSIVAKVKLEFPIEAIIAFDIASFCMTIISTFFRWRMLFNAFKRK